MSTQPQQILVFTEDLALVQRCIDRDPAAFLRFVELAEPVILHAILATLRRCGQRPERFEVGDLQADLLVSLVQQDFARLRRYAGRCGLPHWLKVVAANHTLDRLRRQRAVVSLEDEAPEARRITGELASPAPAPDRVAAARQELSRLQAALRTLPQEDQRFVELHYIEGLGLPEVAEAMGASVDAIYARSSRLRQRLRRAMQA